MPELPEVEIARQQLTQWTVGRSIHSIGVTDTSRVKGKPASLLEGRCVRWDRRGKLLLGTTDKDRTILAHLGMTGKWVADPGTERPHQRFALHFADGTSPHCVVFIDTRRFGFVDVVPTDSVEDHPRVRALGPDALDPIWTSARLEQTLGSSRSPLKQKLMDQHVIAGLGNIAVSEIAWRARVHPHTPSNVLQSTDWEALIRGIRDHVAVSPSVPSFSVCRPAN